ncbi:MAG: UDP-3-O-(3-hydroxymyristoyl)glucosamine N-acyltransferase [Gammaproteobacteria bacterium]|nr:UDP-3-O-(3-hydroxymyristoyl)glucosamine N-acyltransferase [Gammaproteobacteria bacterium]MCD8541918.1 UDP-3-O-(3-hydroxymyristoyl)glucosamine N-acyltransferase [Gammaproteobacteria bacterium]
MNDIPSYSLKQLAEQFSLEWRGDPEVQLSGIAPIEKAEAHHISFLENSRYQKYLSETRAGVVVLPRVLAEECRTNCLITDTPYLTYAKIAGLFLSRDLPSVGIHPTAIVDPSAHISSSVALGPYVVIGPNVHLDDHVIIGAGSYIGAGTHIAEKTCLWPHVSVYHDTEIGCSCEIKSGAVLGGDGFGFAPTPSGWHKIPQLGRVIIGDRVSIGANTTIDRGSTQDTVIATGVIIDNQVQIAHNVSIGENTAIAGCVGIAGSTHIGKNCQIGGGAGIGGHLVITDNVAIAAMSGITKSIREPGQYIGRGGMGVDTLKTWLKLAAKLRGIDKILARIKKLEE